MSGKNQQNQTMNRKSIMFVPGNPSIQPWWQGVQRHNGHGDGHNGLKHPPPMKFYHLAPGRLGRPQRSAPTPSSAAAIET